MLKHDVPLCVDLDGSLIRTDMLLESALDLLHRNPLYIFAYVRWLLGGNARLKKEIARRVTIDVSALPYDERVLEHIRREAATRQVVLCTATDETLAESVAAHVGSFSKVLASDGRHNLSGEIKSEALRALYGERGFDYLGNERKDLAVWRRARGALVVNASDRLVKRAAQLCRIMLVLPRQRAGWRAWLQALRLHQWLKNVLVFLPLLAAHRILDGEAMLRTAAAFVIFGVCASSGYLLNDLLDLQADRQHPRKRNRPFAAGRLSLGAGILLAPSMTAAALVAAWFLSHGFALTLAVYYVLSLSYSFKLKQIVMLDVLLLATLYTLRIIAGAAASATQLSFWLLAFSMFLFLSLAMLKRYTELRGAREGNRDGAHGRGYGVEDLALVQSLGGASGYLSVLVLALYIHSTASDFLYRHPQLLWLLCPVMLYWISRVWIIAHRGDMHDDPVIFAITDRASRVLLVISALIIVGATV